MMNDEFLEQVEEKQRMKKKIEKENQNINNSNENEITDDIRIEENCFSSLPLK